MKLLLSLLLLVVRSVAHALRYARLEFFALPLLVVALLEFLDLRDDTVERAQIGRRLVALHLDRRGRRDGARATAKPREKRASIEIWSTGLLTGRATRACAGGGSATGRCARPPWSAARPGRAAGSAVPRRSGRWTTTLSGSRCLKQKSFIREGLDTTRRWLSLPGYARYAPGLLSKMNTLERSLQMALRSFVYEPRSGVQCCL